MTDTTIEQQALAHAKEHPGVIVVVSSTLRPGFISCIGPVPTLFGAEIHCRAEDEQTVRAAITEAQPNPN